jgi:hypothetical protein
MIKRCYYKQIAISRNPEARLIRLRNKDIPFNECSYSCTGFEGYTNCKYFKLKEFDDCDETVKKITDEIKQIGTLDDIDSQFDLQNFGMGFK